MVIGTYPGSFGLLRSAVEKLAGLFETLVYIKEDEDEGGRCGGGGICLVLKSENFPTLTFLLLFALVLLVSIDIFEFEILLFVSNKLGFDHSKLLLILTVLAFCSDSEVFSLEKT
jgi:hypothetical protein